MPLIGRRRRSAPRPAPELDDLALGQVLRGIAAPRGPGPQEQPAAKVVREQGRLDGVVVNAWVMNPDPPRPTGDAVEVEIDHRPGPSPRRCPVG
jgi:hypothetical protein